MATMVLRHGGIYENCHTNVMAWQVCNGTCTIDVVGLWRRHELNVGLKVKNLSSVLLFEGKTVFGNFLRKPSIGECDTSVLPFMWNGSVSPSLSSL